ncbi:hypothetical protein PanWU01x14_252930 [Parasponia andersonii]|uniref:Uncharacterized protein n=1 Tax=Parasponia andersonii TaxID=3476 RepID=A0A2P5BBW6_PARAD|nr:hypothetical protein PanWU01x14_252930 [Parasponia andersonii]
MASLAISQKNWACFNGCDELEGVEISKINGAFLMSLMEELQDHVDVEERDEERLNSVIRSLEAEINSCTTEAEHDSCVEPDHQSSTFDGEDSQSCELEQMNDHDFTISFEDLDMNGWINMEAEPCSPSHEMNYYVYQCEDDMINGVEGISIDYSTHNYCGAVRDQEHGYNSL